jgi:cation diffusion facilitator CzcD-associated flavoprotein CzcO
MTTTQLIAPILDVIIVGSGFSGLCMSAALLRSGVERFVVLEKANDLGGTWRENTYPGCACDIPSFLYSLSFAPSSDWSRLYAPQPEILAYLQRFAREHSVLPHIRFRNEVQRASWNEIEQHWSVQTNETTYRAKVLVIAAGGLHTPKYPSIPGLQSFKGRVVHSAQWPHDGSVEKAKRVAVIGTGATAVQLVPKLAESVGELLVFQRTPPWIVSRGDRPISKWQRKLVSTVPGAHRLIRSYMHWSREVMLMLMHGNRFITRLANRAARKHLEEQVPDPALRAKLAPQYRMGCKRILLSDDYYPTFSRSNVRLVTSAIERMDEGGIVTAEGESIAIDVVVLATGFVVTPFLTQLRVEGTEGRELRSHWEQNPATYLGITTSHFPNLFTFLGPNTGLGHNSIVTMIEAQAEYVSAALRTMRTRGIKSIELRPEVQDAWFSRVQSRLQNTVWASSWCSSWYQDRHGRVITLWPGSVGEYVAQTRRFDLNNYQVAA